MHLALKMQILYVIGHRVFVDDGFVQHGLFLQASQVFGHLYAGEGFQAVHLVEFVAGQVAADGGEDGGGELIGEAVLSTTMGRVSPAWFT